MFRRPHMDGTLLLAQESRFLLETEQGRGHLFVLSHGANREPQDLPAFRGKKLRVAYSSGGGLLALVAHRITVLEENPP